MKVVAFAEAIKMGAKGVAAEVWGLLRGILYIPERSRSQK